VTLTGVNDSKKKIKKDTYSLSCFFFLLEGADLPTCNYCSENDAASCSRNERPEICALDPNSLGTTHCGTAVGKYLDSSGNEQNLFYRGCFDSAGE